MKIKARVPALIIVMIILVLLCACNGAGDTRTPPDSPDVSVQPTTPAEIIPPADVSPSPDEPSPAIDPPVEPEPDQPEYASGELIISFDYTKQSGSASNQYAVWIEDINGMYIKTLYATKWAAEGGYKSRPDAIAFWVTRANRASMPDAEVDAVSGATPKTGPQSYTWDLTDKDGSPVPVGEYMFLVEGTLRWKNFAIYSGVISIGDAPVTVTADRGYVYEKSDSNKALTEDSPENNMIGTVTATFTPIN
jgi:hypothetical protein